MWEQDWALLGIEPTTELAAIKKAYALKLKVTRPDDDADAYQALRDTYERVQHWAKWQRDNEAGDPAVTPVEAVAVPDAPPAEPEIQEPEPEPAPEPEHVVQPRHLIEELELRWRRSGEPALMFGWDEARRELDQQPLSRQAEFSAAFAQWVLNLQNLPDEFLRALDAHFGWLSDFRTARQLGPELAQALHDALDSRLRPQAVDPAVRALAAPLLGLQALRAAHRSWTVRWLFLLLHPLLARNQGVLGPPWLQHLGLDLETQRWLKDNLKQALWTRVALVSTLVGAACLAMFGDPVIAAGHGIFWLVGTGLLMAGGLVAGMLLNSGVTLTSFKTPSRSLGLPLERWRRNRLQPQLGLIWLLFAAWLATREAAPAPAIAWQHVPPLEVGMAWLQTAGAWGFGIAGLLAAWPLVPVHGCVVAGLAPLVGYLFTMALQPWLPLPACLLVGAAWMLLAVAAHEERLRLTGLALWPLRPMLNSLALAQRWTYSVAVLPLAGCTAWAVVNDGHVSPLRIFVVWVLGMLLVGWLQGKAETWALRQLPDAGAGAA